MQRKQPNQELVAVGLAICLAGIALTGVVAWSTAPSTRFQAGSSSGNSADVGGTAKLTMPLQAFEPLVPGTIAPRIEAAGWLNGEPQNEVAGDESGRVLTVLDIWANWCPVCQTAPPAPVKLYEKYHGRNVRFISLTDVSREAAEQLIARFSIAWPSGYGSPDGTINAYGALRLEARPGREINPIVYLIGPDGRILWSDGNARPKHENFGAACGKLDQEIEAALRMLANEAVSK